MRYHHELHSRCKQKPKLLRSTNKHKLENEGHHSYAKEISETITKCCYYYLLQQSLFAEIIIFTGSYSFQLLISLHCDNLRKGEHLVESQMLQQE